MHGHLTPGQWATALGDPDDRHGWQLFACPDCSPARGDLEAGLHAAATCPRCWLELQTNEPVPAEVLECETCMAAHQVFEEWVEKVEHYEPMVALEWPASEKLLREVERLVEDDRLTWVASDPAYQQWGYCQRVLGKSRSLWLTDPREAHRWASVGAVVADLLDEERYGPSWVADLRAKAHAYLANTFRLIGRFAPSEREFALAERWVDKGVGRGRAEATVLSLKGSLLLDQHRHLEAEALLDRVKRHFDESEQRHEVGRTLLKLAMVSQARDLPGQAAKRTEEALELIDPEREPYLPWAALQNLVGFRLDAGDIEGARAAFETLPEPEDHLLRVRRTCLEAHLLREEGDLEGAARLYDDVRIAYLAEELHYEIALVSLEMAIVATLQGRTEAVRELARDAVVLLTRSGAPQEAFAAIRLLVDSLEREAVSATFIQQIARKLARHQPAQ